MNAILGVSFLAAVTAMSPHAADVDWESLNNASMKESMTVIRPGEPGKAPFWNVKSKAFIHPPAFDFEKIPGALKYRFVVTELASGKRHEFFADVPWAPVTPVWAAVGPGYVLVVAEGIGVSEVCERCGFSDYSNFLKAFTKSVGISPKKYSQYCNK